MTSRQQVVQRWQSRLRENQSLLAEGSAGRRWLRSLYVKLYRFLLTCYGSADWRAATSDHATTSGQPDKDDVPASRMELKDLQTHESGKPPKSGPRIRKTLETVHAANESLAKPGPLVNGLHPADWITVATSRDERSVNMVEILLRCEEIDYRRINSRREFVIEVRARDRDRAFELFTTQAQLSTLFPLSDTRPAGKTRITTGLGIQWLRV